MTRRLIRILLLLVGVVALSGAVLASLNQTSNCDGNSAALAAVTEYAVLAKWEAEESPFHSFLITAITPQQRGMIQPSAGEKWVRPARFLVSTAPVTINPQQPRRVIIVCDTPYTNVPKRWFGKAPPTHAAGFSDGTRGLISPTEFAALDLSSFTALDKPYPRIAGNREIR